MKKKDSRNLCLLFEEIKGVESDQSVDNVMIKYSINLNDFLEVLVIKC